MRLDPLIYMQKAAPTSMTSQLQRKMSMHLMTLLDNRLTAQQYMVQRRDPMQAWMLTTWLTSMNRLQKEPITSMTRLKQGQILCQLQQAHLMTTSPCSTS